MRLMTIFGILACGLVIAPAAHAAVSASASDGAVNIDGSATVPVTVTCPPGSVVLEAHLSLSQDDGAIWGMASLGRVRCNGRPNTYLATVTSYSGSFQAGTAFASPYVLVQRRGGGANESGGSFNEITLR